MSSVKTEPIPGAKPVDMKLEVIMLGVSDVDRAKAFYQNLGWRIDIDVAGGDFRGVQVTPHNSQASIIFGKGVTPVTPGSAVNLVLAVDDVDLASPADDDQLLAVNDALDRLAAQHKEEAELVKLRYFVGLTNDEAAEVLGISPRTAKYFWTRARAWLFQAIQGEEQVKS